MNLHYDSLFAIPIIQRLVPGMENFNTNLVKNLDSWMDKNPNAKPINWSCDLYSSDIEKNILHHKLFKDLKQPIITHANELCEIMGYDNERFRPIVEDCWLNVYGQLNNQELHNHPNRHLSGVYYPTATEGNGASFFRTPLFGTNYESVPIKKPNNTNTGYFIVETVPSKMVLFPSYLLHCVTPNRSDQRICIAFNINLKKN